MGGGVDAEPRENEKVWYRNGEDEGAMEKEKRQVAASFHEYTDGTVDQPFLNTRHSKGLNMDPESLSVILPCWSLAIGFELIVVGFF